jgi:hypothetical protein
MRNSVHGITTETMQNLLLDAGKIVINYLETNERDLGATLGGNSFNVEAEIKDIRPDGAKGKVKGGRRIVDVATTLTVNMFEMTKENLLLALPGSVATPDNVTTPTADVITRSRNILDTDYVKNITYVGTISGKDTPVIITLFNALQDGAFELSSEDKEEASTELTFSGHFDPATMEKEPWEIRYPLA